MQYALQLALGFFLTVLFRSTRASPTASDAHYKSAWSQPRPLVIWHGMGSLQKLAYLSYLPYLPFLETGDSHSSEGMLDFISMIQDVHPGIFVHSIYIEEDLTADQRAGFVRATLPCLNDKVVNG